MKASTIMALGAAAAVNAQSAYVTSTVYATNIYTVTSCAPTVTNCPVGHVTTDIVSLYTTVCPVAATETVPPPYPTNVPGGYESSVPVPPVSYPAGPETSVVPPPPATFPVSVPADVPTLSTLTISTCVPSYITSVITVYPTTTPVAPPASYPVGGSTPSYPAAPSGSLPYNNNSTVPFVPANGASAKSAGGLLMAVGIVAAFL